MNETLAEFKLIQHPDKTFTGRIGRGFDFLGYEFTPAGLNVAPQTTERCVKRVSQLYEQGVDMIHIGCYVRRWRSGRWAVSGEWERSWPSGHWKSSSSHSVGWDCPPAPRLAFANQHAGEPTNNSNTREHQ